MSPGEKDSLTHWIGSSLGPVISVDDMGKRKSLLILGLEIRPLGCKVRRHPYCAIPSHQLHLILVWFRQMSFALFRTIYIVV
jgi:hypothetical protein